MNQLLVVIYESFYFFQFLVFYFYLKKITKKTPEWIIKNSVKTVKTAWCSENLVKALCQMLKKALKNKSNKYFALLSGACIPLFTFNKTYHKINKTKKTRMSYYKLNLFNKEKTYYADQWVILNRKTSKGLLRLYNPKDKLSRKFV